jgi:endonuclease YncB( thermonuclease family)
MGGKKAMRHFLNALSFAVALLPATLCAAQIQGKVIRVLDGDTIEVLQEQQPVRVRLLNIDAPEKKQPFGRWSTNQLKAFLQDNPLPSLIRKQIATGESWDE